MSEAETTIPVLFPLDVLHAAHMHLSLSCILVHIPVPDFYLLSSSSFPVGDLNVSVS